MACTFGLWLAGVDARYAQQAAWAAFDELDRLEALLSRFIPHGDVGRINAARPGEWVRVAPETIACLTLASNLYRQTKTAFDVAFRSRSRRAADMAPLVLDAAGRAIRTQAANVMLDLGALGKGYALDQMAAVLRDWSVPVGLLHGGQSSLLALGSPPDGLPWRVHLRDPADQARVLARVPLESGALSGSGQVLHGPHIVDPRTGAPPSTRAAWAVAPTAALSDALSTAFMVMTPAEIDALCGERGEVSAIVLAAPYESPRLAQYGRPLPLEMA